MTSHDKGEGVQVAGPERDSTRDQRTTYQSIVTPGVSIYGQ